MPTPHTLMLFSGIALLFAASPGPNFVYVLSRSVGYGRHEGLMSVLGIGTGALVHTTAAVLGISALLSASAVAFDVVKYAGVAYLIFLGVKTLLKRDTATELETRATSGNSKAYRQGLVTMLLNPKAALYYFSFLPQFVDPNLGNVSIQLTVFGVMQALAAVTVYTLVAFSAGFVGELIRRRKRFRQAQQWVTGCTYVALGAGIALTGRK